MPPRWFEIRVEGELPADWSFWFEGLEVRSDRPGESTLRGLLADQAALHGVLAKIRDLNLTLIAVSQVPPAEGPESEAANDR